MPEVSRERRIGKRAEQKRRWDREQKRSCVEEGCEHQVWLPYERCPAHYRARQRAAKEKRWREIEALWNAGTSLAAIAAELGMTVGYVGVDMARMRREGWDIPHRYRVRNV